MAREEGFNNAICNYQVDILPHAMANQRLEIISSLDFTAGAHNNRRLRTSILLVSEAIDDWWSIA